ncbi:coiled-coil domain-containing protein 157 isoform X1 [Oryzias melastigma]|nr:coiled-coil domain-containing protein 157 isoform X1 [Oryzias melastigma]
MNSLLGRRDSINNLRKDIVDIQGAILDVLSRTGAVCASSWKFPDKLSCHLDIVALLEEYDFVEGEDDYNQHSHVVLLELMIDRFLLLLQSVSVYAEQQMGVYRPEGPTQRGGKSVGLVVRNYWGDLCQFANEKELFKNISKKTKSVESDDANDLSFLKSSSTTCSTHSSMSWSSTSSFKFIPQSDVAISSPEPTPFCPKTECHNVSCQTARTSLIPCDACRQVQSLLRKTGESLIDLFRSEGLPSSLQSLSADVDEKVRVGHMPAADVAQWANEQLRDMRRLAKHLQDVRGTVVPLQDRVAAAKMECETIKAQLETAEKEFKEKLEKHQANIEQLEFSLQEAERSAKETEKKHQEEHKQLQKEICSSEEANARLREKVASHQETIHTLECEKNLLQENVKKLQTDQEAFCQQQQKIHQLERQISDTQLLLDKEKAKYQSACRQQESTQMKQKSLLKRIEELDEECEELKKQLVDSEEAQIKLDNELQQMKQLQARITQKQDQCVELQKKNQRLETREDELKRQVSELTDHVRALRDRERLLVAFPELQNWAQPQTTGNVVLDMEQQLQANSIRVNILQQENTTLHKSLQKLRKAAQPNCSSAAHMTCCYKEEGARCSESGPH